MAAAGALTAASGGAAVGTGWPIALAVSAAVGYGLASVMQAAGVRSATGTLAGVRRPAYLGGVALDLLAWMTSLVALRSLPVYQVQSILAGSLAVAALAARAFLRAPLHRRDVAAIAVAVACLAVIALSSSVHPAAEIRSAARWAVAAVSVPVSLIGVWAARRARPAVAAVAAGLAFGGTALCSRAATVPSQPLHDVQATLVVLGRDPLVWALAVYGVSGVLLYANALRNGSVGPVTALLWITEVVAPALVGVGLLGDRVRPGWAAVAVVAVTGVVAAAAVLATSAGQPHGRSG
jgi:drug/metabolite transporter (DMT)-like permease